MKVLFNCSVPFMLAHGGVQVQIDQTKLALERQGVAVEFLRWWDQEQAGEVLHHFGRVPVSLVEMAQAKGLKVVQSDLLTAQGSRPPWKHRLHRLGRALMEAFLPESVTVRFGWKSYRLADANIALTPWEAHLMRYLFAAPAARVHVVPNGVESVFFAPRPRQRGDWLVCTATITPRKRVLELAEAALAARTPLWVIGRAYSDTDPYSRRFAELAGRNPAVIRHEGAIADRTRLAEIYSTARGFVLLSAMESLSLSALEAAACECPLLLSDLPWARGTFGEAATYCPLHAGVDGTAQRLRRFYDAAGQAPAPPRPSTWDDVARQLQAIYASLS